MVNRTVNFLGNYLQRLHLIFLCAVFTSFFLSACASSDVTRDVSSNIDVGVENTKDLVEGAANSNIADSYQNMSQAKKGALVGGAAGATVGVLSSSVGVLPGALVGAVMGASYGSYIDTYSTLEDQLQNRGATIVLLGDQVLIVLPSARLFKCMSAIIKPSAYSTLYLVTRYINGYTKMLVKITGYTDAIGSPCVNLALSQAQADSVLKFLAASGVDARVLYAIGRGGTHLVQRKLASWGESDNYRIEITLEKQYV